MRKKLQVTTKKIIDPASEKERGTWYDYLLIEPEEAIAQKKGSIYGVASIRGRWGIKGDELITFFFNNFKEFYYQNPENQVTKNLEQSIKFAHKKLVAQLSGDDSTNTFFNFVVFILWGNVLYVAQVGKAKAILVRGEEIETIGSHLVDTLKEELFANTIHIASGLIKSIDFLVLGMPDFWKYVDTSKLKLWLHRLSFDELEKKLLKTYDEQNIAQSLFLNFSVGIYPSEEEIINITIPVEEQKNERIKKRLAKFIALKRKIQNLFTKKPLTVTLHDKPQLGDQKLPKVEFTQVKEEIKADTEMNLENKEAMEALEEKENQDNTQGKPRTLQPQNPGRLWDIKASMGAVFQKYWRKIQTRFSLFKNHIIQARTDANKSKEQRIVSDPSSYINRRWWTQLFVKKGLIIVVVLALLLVASVYLTNSMRKSNSVQLEYDQVYTDMITEIEQVQRISFTSIERQEVYQKGRETLDQLEAVAYDSEKVQGLRDSLQSLRDTVYNITRVDEAKVVTDATLKNDNANPQTLALIEDTLYLLDDEQDTLYSVSLIQDSVQVASFEGKNWKLLLSNKDELYGFSSEQIGRYDGVSTFDTIIEKDERWQTVTDMGDYFGNIYLLDPQANQIWKYTAFGNDFSAMVGYLTVAPDTTFSQAVSIAVDGAIYVLLDDGQIWKFLMGKRTEYVVQNLDVAFANPTQIFTREESEFMYVLDTGNRRVVLLDKQGNYKRQYTSENWGSLKDFAFNTDETKMYLLNGTQVLEIPLEGTE